MDLKDEKEIKRRRSESPVSIPHEHNDRCEESDESKNKRFKSERAASPTHSYLSLRSDWSMDPPTNLKGGEARVKSERAASPAHSYLTLKTDWSMDPPTNLKLGEASPLVSRVKSERAASPTHSEMSLRTDWSMDPPTNLKGGEAFPLNSSLVHYLRCSICKSMLKDPVSIPCGHNHCRDCINAFWENCAEDFVCPQCGKGSKTRPALNTNAALSEVVKNMQQAGFSPALPPSSYPGPEDVACDFCSEQRLKAVKVCSICDVFLCEIHIRHHYTIPALQKHTLSDVTEDLVMRHSQQHQTADSVCEQQDHTDHEKNSQDITQDEVVRSLVESWMNTSKPEIECPTEASEISKPQTEVNKDPTGVKHLERICSTLQQEVSVLKRSLSKLKGKNPRKETYYDEDEEDDTDEEDDDDEIYSDKEDYDERSDDEERDEDSYNDEDGYEDDIEGDEEEKEDDFDQDGEEDDYDDEEEKYGDDYDEDKDYDDEDKYWDHSGDEEDNSENEDDYDNYF